MSEIKIGDYVIMNNSDKPCTRLIARVIELPDRSNSGGTANKTLKERLYYVQSA